MEPSESIIEHLRATGWKHLRPRYNFSGPNQGLENLVPKAEGGGVEGGYNVHALSEPIIEYQH